VAAHLKILIVTDAWTPQVNGVVRTLQTLGEDLGRLGHTVHFITPLGRRTFPLPTYPEIRLAFFQRRALAAEIRDFAPDAVHIATEGSLGLAARRVCLNHGIAFTTAFHTRFAEYVHARFRLVPEKVIWRWLRWFHHPAAAVMATTPSMLHRLEEHGFRRLRIWSRGVDIETFHPVAGHRLPHEAPIWLFVGRVAVEKNIEAFLALDLPIREALASGLTVAAYPVEGPVDVVGPDAPGAADVAVLDEDLRTACLGALALKRKPGGVSPREFAEQRSWRACTLQFLRNIAVEPDQEQP
jgi:glycosyltransferase involved in cell wall biosynthesis